MLLQKLLSARIHPLIPFSLLLLLAVFGTGCAQTKTITQTPSEGTAVGETNYHGWAGSFVIRNPIVEVMVVPKIGRIMQFGFLGEEGVFWENRTLDGKPANWEAKDWINFGGDKTWPAPEAEWTKFTKHAGWKPPPAFDGRPHIARRDGNDLVMVSEVDTFYGIRVTRRIHLDETKPVMTVTTTYERPAQTTPTTAAIPDLPVGIWIITQLKEPLGVYVPRPKLNLMADGYLNLIPKPAPSLTVDDRVISMARDKKTPYKIGTEASTLLWVNQKATLQIDSPRDNKGTYPDRGSSAEIYTNPDPLPYIEMEMLGPLHNLRPGGTINQVNTYTLGRRTEIMPDQEVRKLLAK